MNSLVSRVELTFLGTGASFGIPMVGCDCTACISDDPRNRRLRSPAMIRAGGLHLLIDAGPDLRTQALRHHLRRVDAVLFTHDHADHTAGIDDLRAFHPRDGRPLPCYADRATVDSLRQRFHYIFSTFPAQGSRPRLELVPVDGPFEVRGERVAPLDVIHGDTLISGYRMDSLAYITDASGLPDTTLRELRGVEVLILNALRHKSHPLHLSLTEAVAVARQVDAKRTYLTHLGHELEHVATQRLLPPGIELAYDGLVVGV